MLLSIQLAPLQTGLTSRGQGSAPLTVSHAGDADAAAPTGLTLQFASRPRVAVTAPATAAADDGGTVIAVHGKEAVLAYPITPTLNAPGIKLLRLNYDTPLSIYAVKINLCRYNTAATSVRAAVGRGLHSSTFRLNVSALYGIGGALRGCLGGV